eukprot:2422446-Prymnesium_polylepis.3
MRLQTPCTAMLLLLKQPTWKLVDASGHLARCPHADRHDVLRVTKRVQLAHDSKRTAPLHEIRKLLLVHCDPRFLALVGVFERELGTLQLEHVDAARVDTLKLREHRVEAAKPIAEEVGQEVHIAVRGQELREGIRLRRLQRLRRYRVGSPQRPHQRVERLALIRDKGGNPVDNGLEILHDAVVLAAKLREEVFDLEIKGGGVPVSTRGDIRVLVRVNELPDLLGCREVGEQVEQSEQRVVRDFFAFGMKQLVHLLEVAFALRDVPPTCRLSVTQAGGKLFERHVVRVPAARVARSLGALEIVPFERARQWLAVGRATRQQ